MKPVADSKLLTRFAGFLTQSVGLHYPAGRHADLLRGMASAASEFGDRDADTCMQRLLDTPLSRREIEILARHLTVGETYFFREPAVFNALEREILPALIQARRQAGNLSLRFWSAGCCSGEEAYSLAILLARMLPDLSAWHIVILGSDINPQALARARGGIYPQWSFRNTPAWVRNGYFKPAAAGRFDLQARIKRMVSFAYINLIEDSYPAIENDTMAMDLILCRNVLMYFDADGTRKVVRNMRRALLDEGWLVVGAVETNQQLFNDFTTVNFQDAVFYRKTPVPEPITLVRLADLISVRRVSESATHRDALPSISPFDVVSSAVDVEQVDLSLYDRAQRCYQQGEYDQAARVLEGGTDSVPSLLLLARTHANLGRFAEAVACCERAMAMDKLDPVCPYLLAVILEEQGQFEAAVMAFRRALYLDPGFVLVHFALGNLKRRLGIADAGRSFANAKALLANYESSALLPESEGMTAGRLAEIIDEGGMPR